MNWLIKHKVTLLSIDVIIMVLSGIFFLITGSTLLGYILVATIVVGFGFATIDVETREQAAEEEDDELEETD